MANLTFNVAGVSVSVNTADPSLLKELQEFNTNLRLVQTLLTNQPNSGGYLTDTAKVFGVSDSTVKKWTSKGMPVVKLDGMHDYYVYRNVIKWLTDNQVSLTN
ncbi:terminase small subunit [Ligilactobacillus animalis]|nr:terminase small subunit [Ligilactobacillus animalis]